MKTVDAVAEQQQQQVAYKSGPADSSNPCEGLWQVDGLCTGSKRTSQWILEMMPVKMLN